MAQIQLRRDTAANWTVANPVLAEGELGVELVTAQVKLGDGTSTWSELDYLLDKSVISDYATEDDAKAAGLAEGDVYHNTSFDKILIIGGPQIPSKKALADAANGEVYYDQDNTQCTVKGVYLSSEVDALLGDKLDVVNPDLQGTPTAPLANVGNDSSIVANTAFVQQELGVVRTELSEIKGNKEYDNETDAKVNGSLNEGDVYYNDALGKALIVGNYQIPASKTVGDAAIGEVFYNQATGLVDIKGSKTVTVNAGAVEADATTTEPRGTLGWDPNPAVMYISSGSFWIKIGQGRADA